MVMHQLKGDPVFPLKIRPEGGWTARGKRDQHSRSFGSSRDVGASKRAHAGCDLYVPPYTEVLAVAAGKVHSISPGFPGNSFAIQVNHDGFIVIYGEVVPLSKPSENAKPGLPEPVQTGDRVTRGQVIAKVAYQGGNSQLHFELYLNPANTEIRVLLSQSERSEERFQPYVRRLTPENPTPYLEQWQAKISEVAPRP